MKPIDLDGFGSRFEANADPWATFSSRDERIKRDAIVLGLGPRRYGRVLELGSGNGSNSVALARHALRLDATEGTASGTELTAQALARSPRAEASQLALPARFPRNAYDAVIVAELLYYLSPRAMRAVALAVGKALGPGGILILAHHRIDFHDFAQHAARINQRFLSSTHRQWRTRVVRRTGRWIVVSAELTSHPGAIPS